MLSRRNLLVFTILAASFSGVRAASLDEDTVKTIVQGSWQATFKWHGIHIAAPRKASIGEISSAGLPPNVTIVPVRVDYTRTNGMGSRDIRQSYFFYQDDYGSWAAQATSDSYNRESDVY